MSLVFLAGFIAACLGVGLTVCGFVDAEQSCREARREVEDGDD